jgi:hypothetical protein
MPMHWWGGPLGRGALWARTPSRRRHNAVGILQGANRPTGASAAVQGDRPTMNFASELRPDAPGEALCH